MFAVMLGQYAVMQMVVAATALVRNKVIAVRLGPSAFGEIAQMAAVVASVVAITAFGMQVSLSRNVARATTKAERQAYLASANGLVLGLSLVATAALALFLVAGNLLTVVGLPVTTGCDGRCRHLLCRHPTPWPPDELPGLPPGTP